MQPGYVFVCTLCVRAEVRVLQYDVRVWRGGLPNERGTGNPAHSAPALRRRVYFTYSAGKHALTSSIGGWERKLTNIHMHSQSPSFVAGAEADTDDEECRRCTSRQLKDWRWMYRAHYSQACRVRGV